MAIIEVQAIPTNTAGRTDLGDSPITAEGVELPEVAGEVVEEEGITGPQQMGELEAAVVVVVVVVVQVQAREEGAGHTHPSVVPRVESAAVDREHLVMATGGVLPLLRLMTQQRLLSGDRTGTLRKAQLVCTVLCA